MEKHGERWIRIWERVWGKEPGTRTERKMVYRAGRGRRIWENARKDI